MLTSQKEERIDPAEFRQTNTMRTEGLTEVSEIVYIGFEGIQPKGNA